MKEEIITLYHVTLRKNLKSILEHGLDPKFAKTFQYDWEFVKKKLEEKGIDTSTITPDSKTTPTYYETLPYKIIWLGDEGVVEKYGNVIKEGNLDNIIFQINIPKKELEKIIVPNPALYGKTNFEDWFEYTRSITNPLNRIRDGLGVRKTDRENMLERYNRRLKMVTVNGKIDPMYLTLL